MGGVTQHINNLLKTESELGKQANAYYPLAGTADDFFNKVRDGVLLSHTVNAIKHNTIDIKKVTPISIFNYFVVEKKNVQ